MACGGGTPAEEGKLSFMVGGDHGAFERVVPILQNIGPKVTYVGFNGLADQDFAVVFEVLARMAGLQH